MRELEQKKPGRLGQKLLFAGLVALLVGVEAVFLANMVIWFSAPDRGWLGLHEQGPHVIAWTRPLGEQAGLRPGDKIVDLNGRDFDTFEELYALIGDEIGRENEYRIERAGQRVTVRVRTGRLGVGNVLGHSGAYWLFGLIFVGIGVLVFLMKPFDGVSWAFLLMTASWGVLIAFSAPSGPYHPPLLAKVVVLTTILIPAATMHLTALFPARREWFARRPFALAVPYALSAALAVVVVLSAPGSREVPASLTTISQLYLLSSLLLFLGSAAYSYFRSGSLALQLQSRMIFTGLAISLLVPTIDSLSSLLFGVLLFGGKIFYYVLLLPFFPLSIGYTIVRHDLFEIDVIVRRTYGYILSTVTVIGAYALIVSGLNLAFRTSDVSKSPVFSIAFALGVVFFFRPIHERFQRFIDRLFYRQRYDYRKTIKEASQAITSILDPERIQRTLLETVVREMFLDNALLLLPNPDRKVIAVEAAEGVDLGQLATRELGEDDTLIKVMRENSDAILRYDLDLHPRYEGRREVLRETFTALASELMLPLEYKGQMRGVISLGRKKSGKMFTPEDLDLLKTLVNQSVIALENAHLFQENLEKGRMEEELKIAHDLQTSMLPEKAPEVEGFAIAARSIAAREVGGDFFDFIEMGGEGEARKLGIVVADVSGKAVSGALVMAATRSVFRALSASLPSVEAIMNLGNQRLHADVKKGMFVAALFAVLDPKERCLLLANAGQTQPILRPGDGSPPRYLETEGDRFPLGILGDSRYEETRVPVRQGDTVIFYTDGIVEAMNAQEEMYGFERLVASVEAGRKLGARELVDRIIAHVSEYVGGVEQHDDLTVVVLEVG